MTTLVGLSLVACKTDDMVVLHGNDTGTEKTFERLVVMPAEGAFKSSLPVGVQQAFVAIAEYSDKTTLDVTPNIQWKSSNIESGTIDKGVLTTLKAGLTSVSASYNEHTSNQVDITVIDAALVSIQLTPAIKSTPLGQTVTMTAAAAFEGGITFALYGGTWTSGTPEVATVSTDGLVTPVAEGTTTITVTKGDIEATTEIRVTAAELVELRYAGLRTVMIAEYAVLHHGMVGIYSDGESRWMEDGEIDYISSKPLIAEFISPGESYLKGISSGKSMVTAKESGPSGKVAISFEFTVLSR